MQSDEPTNEQPVDISKRSRWDLWHIVFGVLALTFAITSIWLWSEVSEEKSESREALALNEQRSQEQLNQQGQRSQAVLTEERKDAALNQATAFAAAIQPIMGFKDQVPEITNRSVQAATEHLARQGPYSYVAITDAAGKVIASSDLTIIDRNFSGSLQEGVREIEGENQATAKIGSEGNDFGWVVVRLRNEP